MSAATIAEPFLLASYPESSAHRKHTAAPLYASLPSSSNADPFVTIAVHGDGVHVLDTSTLHTAVSHTLGPSTAFSCPPASRTTRSGGGRVCTTYAVLETGPDVQPDGKGKTAVAWEETLSGGVMAADSQGQKRKRVGVAPHPVSHIYAPEYLPDHEVLVGPHGQLTVVDAELRTQHTFTPQIQQTSNLLKHFLFHSPTCSFLPPHSLSSSSAISVSFLRSGDVTRVSVVSVTEDGSLSSLGECSLPVDETDIADISFSSSGFISVLLNSGTWHSLSLTASPSSLLSVSSTAEPLRLQALTFTSPNRAGEVSISALTSSHVVLVAVTSGSPTEIVSLLWDLRYGVLLSQQAIPTPSTLPRPKKTGAIIRLSVSSVSPADLKAPSLQLNGLLTLAPAPSRDVQADGAPARSTILVVPLSVPAKSTIAAAMGRANAGARWISTKPGPNQAARSNGPELSAAARKALKEMRASISGSAGGNATAAEAAFFEYFKPDTSRKAVAAAKADAAEGRVAPVEYGFVHGVLELVLPSVGGQPSGQGAYSAKIVQHLLEKRVVGSSMAAGGILPALAAREDWVRSSIFTAEIRNLSGFDRTRSPSRCAQLVVAHAKTSSASDADAMQVDSESTSAPPLPAFLAQCVVYPFTPALQRVAVRKHLADASALVPILETLDAWIVRHTEDDALLAASPVASSHSSNPSSTHPSSPSSPPARTHTRALENLCGPLAPFARAAAAKAREGTEAATKDADAGGRDWRRKRKAAQEQAAGAVGLYQVEELVL
ncbi:hypothetical protein C2E23DRAFT_867127 [Lenzites betulinus]|nr:hypothetical protein C2E23DRAFT_867127 [Lenzites betulinus]